MAFQKATRKNVKIKIGLTGPSGSGKTLSALFIASGLGKKIALIDTENESASLYSDKVDFDTSAMFAPFTPLKLIQEINQAVDGGYDVIVIDSMSHFWAGEGGVLDEKTAKDQRGGNSFTNWAEYTKIQNKMIAKIMDAPIHIICTLRSKSDYVMEANQNGKQAPRKVGLAPIQRDGVEYEFSIVFDMAMNHSAIASKDRTGLFDGVIFTPTKEVGIKLKDWLSTGKEQLARPKSEEEIVSDLVVKALSLSDNIKDATTKKRVEDFVSTVTQKEILLKVIENINAIIEKEAQQ